VSTIENVTLPPNTEINLNQRIADIEADVPVNDEIVNETMDTEIENFEMSHKESHGTSIAWTHKELDIKIFATPNFKNREAPDVIDFESTHGLNIARETTEQVEIDGPLTLERYLKEVRSYIESYWLTSQWEEIDSKDVEGKWRHPEADFNLILTKEEERYVLGFADGISGGEYDTFTDQTNAICAGINYRQGNPAGRQKILYEKAIEQGKRR